MKNILEFLTDFDVCLSLITYKLRDKSFTKVAGNEYAAKAMESFFTKFYKFAKTKHNGHPHKLKIVSKFDELRAKWFIKSRVVERRYNYAWDFPCDPQLFEMFWQNNPAGQGIDKVIDRYFLNTEFARAIRKRGAHAAKLARMACATLGSTSKRHINILILGPENCCASGQFEKHSAPNTKWNLDIPLNCSPNAALHCPAVSFSTNLPGIAVEGESSHETTGPGSMAMAKKYDIIIIPGMFEYLDNDQFAIALSSIYKLLRVKGSIIIGNMAKCATNTFETEWIWKLPLWLRGKHDLTATTRKSGLKNAGLKTVTGLNNKFHFIIVRKKSVVELYEEKEAKKAKQRKARKSGDTGRKL